MYLNNCEGCGKLQKFIQVKSHRVEGYCKYGGGLLPLANVEKCPMGSKSTEV